MSIFDDVVGKVSSGMSSIASSASGMVNDRASALQEQISDFTLSSAGTALAERAIGQYAPSMSGAFSRAMAGDFAGAGLDALKQTEIGAKFNRLLSGDFLTSLLFGRMRNPLLGGITPTEARRILDEVQATPYARRNLFYIEVQNCYGMAAAWPRIGADRFNLFVTGVSLTPRVISGEGRQIGSGSFDALHGTERLELRITTLDDAHGTVKRWFQGLLDQVARKDGTFGVPADYLVKIRILHAAINDETMKLFGGYQNKFVVRPTQMDTELSRAENALQELQLSFSQFDTFMFDQT
ncbi:hypothetical protein [Paraburkholderia sp. J10-1]|uniref:hypothetical protein n=1 Tax=Paraburkholderia sp. J10-1 TaxID=2805430 RepID=UPI002AB77506|nr:hypothetical protein [Paraburkholderia sp. J10-1]